MPNFELVTSTATSEPPGPKPPRWAAAARSTRHRQLVGRAHANPAPPTRQKRKLLRQSGNQPQLSQLLLELDQPLDIRGGSQVRFTPSRSRRAVSLYQP